MERHVETTGHDVNEDAKMGDETLDEMQSRYINISQDEVSDPDESAQVHHGHMDQETYERMIAFSRADRIRFNRAMKSLQHPHDEAAAQGNWEENASRIRALNEVQELVDIA